VSSLVVERVSQAIDGIGETLNRGRETRRGPMSSFDIDVTGDGGCWTVHIREVNGPAQGRTISPKLRRFGWVDFWLTWGFAGLAGVVVLATLRLVGWGCR
jgi:hypothetical protein